MRPSGPDDDARLPTYQLALSYADADREYVRQVADALVEHGVTVFDRSGDMLLGRYGPAEVQRAYRDDVGHAILFTSAHYAIGGMSKAELWAALDRMYQEPGFALPARLDETEVPGLPTGIQPVDLVEQDGNRTPPDEFAQRVVNWLRTQDGRIHRRSGLSGWTRFDPSKLHCVVIGCESDPTPGGGALGSVFRQVLGGPEGREVWRSARACLDGTATPRGVRDLPAEYQPDDVARTVLPAADAVESAAALDHAVRLIVEADLAIVDVSCFEPAVMLLLGVRAATRRGITVVSHGEGWAEGTPLDRPFNLADLSLGSHSRVGMAVGGDPRVPRLAQRIRNGFDQLRRHPHYHDLPVYDALRELGAESARSPIPIEEEVLVLCTYDEGYYQTWSSLRAEMNDALVDRNVSGTTIARMQDLLTPQIVSQALYERIRRCVGCVVDWTRASPSTFFELGVRLVASPWGTVQLAAQPWLDRIEADEPSDDRERLPPPVQIRRLLELFEPVTYTTPPGPDLGAAVAERLIEISESRATSGHRVRAEAVRAVQQVEPRLPGVATALRESADGLDSPDRGRYNLPQALFFESHDIKVDHEHAARERRVAAWLYLEHRVGAGSLNEDDPMRQLWRTLGSEVSERLLASDEDSDIDLGLSISDRVNP